MHQGVEYAGPEVQFPELTSRGGRLRNENHLNQFPVYRESGGNGGPEDLQKRFLLSSLSFGVFALILCLTPSLGCVMMGAGELGGIEYCASFRRHVGQI